MKLNQTPVLTHWQYIALKLRLVFSIRNLCIFYIAGTVLFFTYSHIIRKYYGSHPTPISIGLQHTDNQ